MSLQLCISIDKFNYLFNESHEQERRSVALRRYSSKQRGVQLYKERKREKERERERQLKRERVKIKYCGSRRAVASFLANKQLNIQVIQRVNEQ